MYKGKMTVYVEGQGEIEVYTIGHVAKLLKKSVETVRAWERAKLIPKAMFKKNNGVRLYHPEEVATMKRVLRKLGKKPLREDLQREMWAALKITRKEILYGKSEDNQDGS